MPVEVLVGVVEVVHEVEVVTVDVEEVEARVVVEVEVEEGVVGVTVDHEDIQGREIAVRSRREFSTIVFIFDVIVIKSCLMFYYL